MRCSCRPASSRTATSWSVSAAPPTRDGWVAVDTTGRTSVPGVWAAGNIVDPRAQVITAAGAGSAAAIALNADLVEEDVRNAVRDLGHGVRLESTSNVAKQSA